VSWKRISAIVLEKGEKELSELAREFPFIFKVKTGEFPYVGKWDIYTEDGKDTYEFDPVPAYFFTNTPVEKIQKLLKENQSSKKKPQTRVLGYIWILGRGLYKFCMRVSVSPDFFSYAKLITYDQFISEAAANFLFQI